jgi:hypothetical protein
MCRLFAFAMMKALSKFRSTVEGTHAREFPACHNKYPGYRGLSNKIQYRKGVVSDGARFLLGWLAFPPKPMRPVVA